MAGARGMRVDLALLVCRVGSRLCGLSLGNVIETMRPLPVEPLAHMPPFVAGLALIRGRPTPVLDARRLLGADDDQRARGRYVTIRLGQRTAALAVDAVVGVRTVDERALAELPAVLQDTENELFVALGALDAELLLVLEHTRLLPEATWEMLELGASPT